MVILLLTENSCLAIQLLLFSLRQDQAGSQILLLLMLLMGKDRSHTHSTLIHCILCLEPCFELNVAQFLMIHAQNKLIVKQFKLKYL